MNTNLYGTILWQMETYLVNKTREIHTDTLKIATVKLTSLHSHETLP